MLNPPPRTGNRPGDPSCPHPTPGTPLSIGSTASCVSNPRLHTLGHLIHSPGVKVTRAGCVQSTRAASTWYRLSPYFRPRAIRVLCLYEIYFATPIDNPAILCYAVCKSTDRLTRKGESKMAKLMATVQGNRGSVHRLGSRIVDSKLQSWTHIIYAQLTSDGHYKIEIAQLHGKTLKVLEGNLKDFE